MFPCRVEARPQPGLRGRRQAFTLDCWLAHTHPALCVAGGYGPPPAGRGAPPPPPPFTSYIVSTPPGGFPPPQGFPQGYGAPPQFSKYPAFCPSSQRRLSIRQTWWEPLLCSWVCGHHLCPLALHAAVLTAPGQHGLLEALGELEQHK